jgi:hypothetical protein
MSGNADRGGKGGKADEGQLADGPESKTSTTSGDTTTDTPATTDQETKTATAASTSGELKAVPPGMVAGMNLVCDFSQEPAGPEEVVFACAVIDAAQTRVSLKGYKQRWQLANATGTAISAKNHALDATADQAWDVPLAIAQAGVVASLFLVDTTGEEHEIKTQCACVQTTPPT